MPTTPMHITPHSHHAGQALTEGPRIRHIDGLRAIAVTAVVGYHAGLPGFDGGFVGVDIFFVISGFLIINQIVSELRQGKFSFATFYSRRTLRILPPFFAMLLGTLVIAAFILVPPYEWEWYGLSALFSSLFVSNMYFLSKQGYFDTAALQKPLLHTWSLSVEEQFYIVAPLLLFGLFWLAKRSRRDVQGLLLFAGLLIFTASLAGCIMKTFPLGRNAAFYVFLWRGWEFIAGGAIAYIAVLPVLRQSRIVAELSGLGGLALVIWSVAVDISGGFFPGYAVMVPVAGSALLLLSGLIDPDNLTARLLALPPMVAIGLISYSWYLWHWPLISFAYLADFSTPDTTRDLLMAALSIIPAVLSYLYIEKPIRAWRHRHDVRAMGWRPVRWGLRASIACALLTGGVGGILYLQYRHTPEIIGDPALIDLPATVCADGSCRLDQPQVGILEGDSHSDAMRATLLEQAAAFDLKLFAPFRGICPAPDPTIPPYLGGCAAVQSDLAKLTEIAGRDFDFVISVRRWTSQVIDAVAPPLRPAYFEFARERLALYSDNGKRRLLVVGPVPDFEHWIAECTFRAERYGLGWDYCARPRADIAKRHGYINDELRKIVASLDNARFVDPLEFFCDDEMCRPYIGRSILYHDDNHLTEFGARWYYAKLRPHFVWAMTGKEADIGTPLR